MATKTNTEINGRKYYRITRTIGHEYKDGKRVPIKKQFLGTSKGNAEQKYKEYINEQIRQKQEKESAHNAAQLKTFGEYAEDYTYNILPNTNYAHGTKRRYESSYRVHIKNSWIASVPLHEVRARTIQDFYASLDVSQETLKAISKWMSAFYKWITLNEYTNNILPAVTVPNKPSNKRHNDIVVWEPAEIKAILTLSESHRLHFMVVIMNYAGLRISECLGLKYNDIRDGFIYVDRQFYQGELSPPKYNSYRKIPAHPEVERAMEIHKSKFRTEAKRNKYQTDFVFTSASGKLLDYSNAHRSLDRFYKANNIPPKSPHTYRATFCTELCRNGVPLEVASKLMGHKSVVVTAKHYALVKQDVQIDAINKLPGISTT